MEFKHTVKDGVLVIALTGELDHHGAASARQEIDRIIRASKPQKVVLELKNVHFCDSSGLGLLMGRYKTAVCVGATLWVREPSPPVERIMKLAGLDKLIKIERNAVV